MASSANDKASRWTPRDDMTLADALVEQKNLGGTRDAAFTSDAWAAVAACMEGSELVSGGARKTVTQCKARWQRLKIEYRIVKHLRMQPGFSWDEQTQTVIASSVSWDAYIADHRDAQPWRKKGFPVYDRVAYLVEDGHGQEISAASKHRWSGLETSEGTMHSTFPPSTSVFAVATPSGSDTPTLPIRPGPGTTLVLPFGRSDAEQQYQASAPPNDGKRRSSPFDDQSASAKRLRSATSSPALQPQFGGLSFGQATQVAASNPVFAPAPSPMTRMVAAIQTMEDTEGLPDGDFVKAVQLFQRRMEVSEAYLAIQSKRARSLYLRAELEDFTHPQVG
ncbi:hypothetical protein M0805_004341 [Coniferiporia weirii]|nr:hypothetical protein M0805_004341 [Coniferiporia weirii]